MIWHDFPFSAEAHSSREINPLFARYLNERDSKFIEIASNLLWKCIAKWNYELLHDWRVEKKKMKKNGNVSHISH